jgi:hypothetical protein
MTSRGAGLLVFAGLLVAGLGALGVAVSDGPHLGFDHLDPWLIVFALGLLTALGALPFVLHARYEMRTEDRDRRWELALTAWGAIAATGAVGFVLFGVVAGFGAASASGSLAIVGALACSLVVGGLAVLIVTTG